jgi:hypothetical protein
MKFIFVDTVSNDEDYNLHTQKKCDKLWNKILTTAGDNTKFTSKLTKYLN